MTDPRLILAWKGLAAEQLQGKVSAERYAPTRPATVCAPTAPLRREAMGGGEQISQLLFGERFDILMESNGYAFGQSSRDLYVGFIDLAQLREGPSNPTHRVCTLRTFAFAEPSIKALALGPYSLNAAIQADVSEGRFIKARDSGWFIRDHLAPIGTFDDDPVRIALQFVGAPYLWGGNDSLGLDCSGLVQQALRACGMACPRDSDQQQALGTPVEGLNDLQRGDLIFWRGHVGLACGEGQLLHANAHHMAVTVEPLDTAIRRIADTSAGLPICLRRPI